MAKSAVTPAQVAGRKFPLAVIRALGSNLIEPDTGEIPQCREMASAVLDKDTGLLLECRQLSANPKCREAWEVSSANEFGRLAQGVGGRVKGTNTIFFINKHEVPEGRFKDVTCVKFVCNERPQKKEVNRMRMTAGGNRINCPGEVATPTADMMLTKILWNSVVSTEGARFMTVDLKDFCLNTPLKRCGHLKIKTTNIPNKIQDEHDLDAKATADGHVCVEVRRGMHGLPQAGPIV